MMDLSSGKQFNSVLSQVLFQQMKPFPEPLLCLGKLLLTELSDNNTIKSSQLSNRKIVGRWKLL